MMAFEKAHFEEYEQNDTPKKKEQPKSTPEKSNNKEQPIDQQKFIENKFIRLDSVFKKENSKVNFHDKEPTAGWTLETKRKNISFHIEKDWGGGKNAELVIKDGKDNVKILLEYPESTLRYEMSVLQNGKALPKTQANAAAIKYIGML